jgi:Tfp pilus assembly protein PilF
VKLTAADAEALLRAGWAALQRGDPAEARAAFERLVEADFANPQVLLLLARACRDGGDPAAEELAVDRLLAGEPGSLRGLIGKGDCRARAGDDRAATSFYKAAMAAGAAAGELPADLAADIERIRSVCERTDNLYRDHLLASLARSGVGEEARSSRFQQSLDIMFGEKRIYLQEPTGY